MINVEETCSCGASFRGTYADEYMDAANARNALATWRKDHKHEPRTDHPAFGVNRRLKEVSDAD